jgi:hypothetical protein
MLLLLLLLLLLLPDVGAGDAACCQPAVTWLKAAT